MPTRGIIVEPQTQCVVMQKELPNSLFQQRCIERRARLQQHGLVIVMGIDRLCLEEALLNRREWNGTNHLRLDDGFRLDQTRQRGEFRNRLILKNVFASQLRTRAISTGDDLYAQNGITAEFEEIVVDTDVVESQHLSPDFSQHLFD